MATAQATIVVVVAAGCSGARVAAGSGVVAAGSGAGPPSPRSSDLLHAQWSSPPSFIPEPLPKATLKNSFVSCQLGEADVCSLGCIK